MKKSILLCAFPTISITNKSELVVIFLVILSILGSVQATERTVGVLQNDPNVFDGYTLFAPMRDNTTYLIDNDGRVINLWESNYFPGNSVYLLENGDILRVASRVANVDSGMGRGGGVQRFGWDGNLLWDFEYFSVDEYLLHHDVELLANGNVLLLVREMKTPFEALTAGRNTLLIGPDGLWPEMIVEVEPNGLTGGKIVWEWHLWDHLVQDHDPCMANYGVVEDSPELLDLNFTDDDRADWIHSNAVEYNEQFDQIIISNRKVSEIWIIDHSTTTAEAAGHSGGNSGKGGDFLYRWGNPQSYRAGDPNDQKLFVQHDAQWIKEGLSGAGNILVFNNGNGRLEGNYSSVDQIVPPVDSNGIYYLTEGSAYGPAEAAWSYVAETPTDFYGSFISGAQRLPNGNTLICSGPQGLFFEVTSLNQIVWQYVNPVSLQGIIAHGESIQDNLVFRSYRYAPDYPGFSGRDLTPGCVVERFRSNMNNDCQVNLIDFGLWNSHWLENNCPDANDCEGADLDLSGIVDPNDLKIFGSEWLWDGSVPQI